MSKTNRTGGKERRRKVWGLPPTSGSPSSSFKSLTPVLSKAETLPLAGEPPSSSGRVAPSYKSRIAACVLLLPAVLFLTVPHRYAPVLPSCGGTHARSNALRLESAKCPVQVEPRNVGPDWKPHEQDGYKELAVERLQGAVQVRTESFDDMGDHTDPRFEVMGNLHAYLEKTFPRVYAKLDVDKVQQYGLLLTWKGSDEKLKPIVLMAHQDTVPVNPATMDSWTYPPWSATLDDDGWMWGRGTTDCKNTLIAIFSTLDKLIEDDFEPTRTIILSSGFDEEIGGSRSARFLAQEIEARYGKDGVAFILDEGFTGIEDAYGRTLARFGTAEKGAVSLKLEVLTTGGHSSIPRGPHTGIGALARIIAALEDHPDTPRLREGNPVLQQLQCIADYGDVDKEWKKRVRNPRAWKKLGLEMAKADPIARAFLATTQAVDLIEGGVKINALPEYASASVNYRIDFLSSVNATLERINSVVEPVVKSLGLNFSSYGSHADIGNNVVRLSVIEGSGIEPAPLTPTEGPAWDLMAGTTRHIWKDAVVTPSGMVANTDTKWTWSLTPNIYRFVPSRLDQVLNFHTVDERIHVDAHLSAIEFFYKLLRNTEGWEAP
ncbi:Gly-Xaa carboxypeptidase [Rhodotorula paludigena]|uniref:Gly-Xaa carboxypeptidase n=1 Tax=Rhodotorula paludigena TaxID=86838 RepID=UPI00318227B7